MTRSGTLIRSVMFVVTVALAGGACGDSDKKAGGTTTPVGGESVRIVNFQFTPQTVTVKPGTKLTWTNDDTTVHSIKDTSPLATPVSQDLGKGATFSITYERPGTYSYICGIHQYMTGTVTVAP